MITRYGMTDEFDMVAMENVTNQYLGGDTSLSCSTDTQKEIDEKVVQLVKAEHEKARKILAENREKLDELASTIIIPLAVYGLPASSECTVRSK